MCSEMVISIFKTLITSKAISQSRCSRTSSVDFFIVALIKSIKFEDESGKDVMLQ